MSNREYHEFRTQCGYITKEKRYLTVFNNIDTVKTSNCDGTLYSDIQYQVVKAFNKLRMMYSANKIPKLE